MSNKTLFYLLVVVIVIISGLILTNIIGFLEPSLSEKYLAYNDVRGIDIQHDGKLWTLNFSQQNEVISILNRSLLTNDPLPANKNSSDKMIIYRFNKPDLVIGPLNGHVFAVPEWDLKSNFQEQNAGELQQVISQSYDP